MAYYTGNTDAIYLYAIEEIIPKTKRSVFGIEKFIKQLQKEGKLNGIVHDKIIQKDMVTDEVGLQNDVLHVRLNSHHKSYLLIN